MNQFIKENWKLLRIYWLMVPIWVVLVAFSVLPAMIVTLVWYFYFGSKVMNRFNDYTNLTFSQRGGLLLFIPIFIGLCFSILFLGILQALNLQLYNSIRLFW